MDGYELGKKAEHSFGAMRSIGSIEEQYDRIYRFCYYRVQAKETAEDLTQETFLRFMDSCYEERGEGIRYLYVIARNLCIEEGRRMKPASLEEDVSDEGKESDNLTNKLLVEQVLEKMVNEDRELLILRYMNGESVADICKIVGISRFALYRKLNRVKKEFMKLMEGGEIRE